MTSKMDTTDSMPVSQRVVAAVADATDTDPLDLEPLYTRIDPDCLDEIFGDGASDGGRNLGRVSFPMAGCRVVVSADGTVDVTEQDAAAEPESSQETEAPVLDTAGSLD